MPRYVFDIILTALGWVAFFFLFVAGILALLRGDMAGSRISWLSPLFLSTLSTVAYYAVMMAAFTAVLIIWAKYNQHRFAGVDRRKPPPPLSAAQLRTSFGLSQEQFHDVKKSRLMFVWHDEDGSISAIQPFDEKLVTKAVSPASSARMQKKKEKEGGWFFLDPQSAVRYAPGGQWLVQQDVFYERP